MSKKRIRVLFIAYSGEQWMGGVYYIKNIVYQFLEYAKRQHEKEYEAYILLDEKTREIFEFCNEYDNVRFIAKKKRTWDTGNDFFRRNMRELCWIMRVYGKRIDYIFPCFSRKSVYRRKIISWIPDFQHVMYPEFFSEEEIVSRDEYFDDIAKNHSRLVLSSKDSYDTYARLYPDNLKGVGIVHFVSAIFESDLQGDFQSILRQYGIIDDNYFIVSNQFYRHKNHKCLIEAIDMVKKSGIDKIQVICTGMTKDTKDVNFFGEIEQLIKNVGVEANIKILGLIPRNHQLLLMKNAIAVVQPSLFEGWGTSAEDAKTLGKILVLSDIDVHREQGNDNSILFRADSPKELSKILIELWNEYYGESKIYEYGIKEAYEYGKMFSEML